MHARFITLFITFIPTLLNFLGLEFMVSDINCLRRVGIEPLSFLELFLSCEATNTFYALAFLLLFYAALACLTRSKAASKILQAAIRRASLAESSNLRRSIRQLDAAWRASYEGISKLLAESNFALESLQRAFNNLRDTNTKLHARNAELEHANKLLTDQLAESQAEKADWERKAKQSDEDAEAREVVHKAERDSAQLQSDTELADLRLQLRLAKTDVKRYKGAAQVAEQSARKARADKKACVAEYEEKGRIAAAESANWLSRAERAEEGERAAKQETVKERLRHADELKEQVKVSNARELISQSRIVELEVKAERSDARIEGLQVDIVGLELTITGLRVDVTSLEVTVDQLSRESEELRAGITSVETSCHELVASCEAKASEWAQVHDELTRENDSLRALLAEDREPVGPAITPPEPTSSVPASVVQYHDDSDTPSLTFCDSGAAIDDSPNQGDIRSPPAQPAVQYTLTTSTSAEIVTSKSGAALIVTSSSTLSVAYDEPSPRTFASHFIPTRHSTPKRSRSSRRPRHTSSGFLRGITFRTMELPLRPAMPIKTSTLRPCDASDLFSPFYRGIDSRSQTDASARFVLHLQARSEEMLCATRPNIPHPARHPGSYGRILYNRRFKLSQTPSGRQ